MVAIPDLHDACHVNMMPYSMTPAAYTPLTLSSTAGSGSEGRGSTSEAGKLVSAVGAGCWGAVGPVSRGGV